MSIPYLELDLLVSTISEVSTPCGNVASEVMVPCFQEEGSRVHPACMGNSGNILSTQSSSSDNHFPFASSEKGSCIYGPLRYVFTARTLSV